MPHKHDKLAAWDMCMLSQGREMSSAWKARKSNTWLVLDDHLPQRSHSQALLLREQGSQPLHIGAAEEEVEVHAACVVQLPHLRSMSRKLFAVKLPSQDRLCSTGLSVHCSCSSTCGTFTVPCCASAMLFRSRM